MTGAASPDVEKRRLRDAIRASLRGIPHAVRHAHGVAAAELLRQSSALREATQVVAFSSLDSEIDTQPLLDCVYAARKPVLFPRMNGEGLEFVRVAAGDRLVIARFGVREPRADKAAESPAAGSLLLVPGLAFDRRGGRLGRGAGYYDRALAVLRSRRIRMQVIGVGFALQIVEQIPMSPHDERVDGILTQDELTISAGSGPAL